MGVYNHRQVGKVAAPVFPLAIFEKFCSYFNEEREKLKPKLCSCGILLKVGCVENMTNTKMYIVCSFICQGG